MSDRQSAGAHKAVGADNRHSKPVAPDRRPTSNAGSDGEDPMLWEVSLAYVKLASITVTVGAVLFILVIRIMTPDQPLRYAAAGTLVLVGAAAWLFTLMERHRTAVYLLSFGAWIGITLSATLLGGVRAPSTFAYVIMIILTGWLFSPRVAVLMAGFTVLVIVGFVAGEATGLLPRQPPTPAALHGVVQVMVTIMSAALILYLVRAYQHRNAELALLTRELQQAQAVAKVGSWVCDLERDATRLSAEACRIFGVPEGTTGNHAAYLALVHPEDRDIAEKARAEATTSGVTSDHEIRIMVRGTIRWIRQTAVVQCAPDGKARKAIGSVQDITDQRLAEHALRASEEKFAKAFSSSPMLISITTRAEGRYIEVNEAFLHLLGHTREDVIGRTSADIGIWSSLEDRQRAIDGLSAPGGNRGTEVVLRKKSGEHVTCEVRGAPIIIDGTPCLIMVTLDSSERKRAQSALQESEARYRTLVEWSPEPIAVHRNGRIVYVNPASVKLLKAADASDIAGHSILDFIHPDSHATALARVQEVRELGRNPGPAELKLIRADGIVIDVDSQGVEIVFDGQPAIHSSLRDLTAYKAAEAARASLEGQLRESQKMEAIGTLAGGIAHDFNNIIATILGNAELARQDAGANAAVLESLEEIRKSGTRARDLVQQILSFSRREPTRRTPLQLCEVAQSVARLLRATLPARVELAVDCHPDTPRLLADKTQMEQVLINLATNAMQALHDAPGRVGIVIDAIAVTTQMADAHPALRPLLARPAAVMVRLRVSDNGAGMTPETLTRMFEPFFTTKPVGQGTGLGLSVVHGIVQAHQGAITVESTLGHGACFAIYLPALPETAAIASPSTS